MRGTKQSPGDGGQRRHPIFSNWVRVLFFGGSQVRNDPRSALAIQVLFIGIVALTIGMVNVLVWLHHFSFSQPERIPVELLVESARKYVSPEPTERFVFAILAICVPVVAFVATLASTATQPSKFFRKIPRQLNLSFIAPIAIPCLLLIVFLNSEFLARVLNGFGC